MDWNGLTLHLKLGRWGSAQAELTREWAGRADSCAQTRVQSIEEAETLSGQYRPGSHCTHSMRPLLVRETGGDRGG